MKEEFYLGMEDQNTSEEKKPPEKRRRRHQLLALAASVTTCVCGLLAASIFLSPTFNSNLLSQKTSTNQETYAEEKKESERILRELKQQYARQEKTWSQNHIENTHLIQRLKDELTKKNSEIEEKEQKISVLQSFNDKMQNASENYQFFSNQFADMQKNHKQLKKNNEKLTMERQNLLEKIAQIEEENQDLLAKASEQVDKIKNLSLSEEEKHEAWKSLKQEHLHVLTLLQEKEARITQTEKEMEAQELEMRMLNDKANSFKELSDQYIAADQNHQKKIDKLQSMLQEANQSIERKELALHTQTENALKEKKELQDTHSQTQTTLENDKQKLTEENALYLSNIELLEQEKQDLINELKNDKNLIASLETKMENQRLNSSLREQKIQASLFESKAQFQREQEMHEDQKRRFNTLLETVKTQKSLLKNIENSRRDIDRELDEMRNAYRQLLSEFTSKQALQSLPDLSAIPAKSTNLEISKQTHTVAQGETLSQISLRYYGTSSRWEEIYEANRSKITNQNFVKVGTELQIP